MTAAVVVMNAAAVAMAADSAVSIPYGRGTKTYTRTRKLLPLHKSQPLAAMVWDAPDYYALPWEVIAADFREQHVTDFQGLDELVEAFFNFVDKEAGDWVATDHEIALLDAVLTSEIARLQELWDKALTQRPDTPARDVAAAAQEVAQTFAKARSSIEGDRWTGRRLEDVAHRDADITDRYESGASGLWDNLDRETRRQLVKVARERLVHVTGDEHGSTGLIFAGYGKNDRFAHACLWRVSGRLGSKTRRVKRGEYEISALKPAEVVPVAQVGVIHSFLNGIHPEVDDLVRDVITSLAQLGEPATDARALAEGMKQSFDAEVAKRADEVRMAVRFFPPDDLAAFAGDLIRMAALRNRATMTPDTVGGPIDVIVLSRADGLRWIEGSEGLVQSDRG